MGVRWVEYNHSSVSWEKRLAQIQTQQASAWRIGHCQPGICPTPLAGGSQIKCKPRQFLPAWWALQSG